MRTSVLARSLLVMPALFAVSAVMAQDVKPTPEVRKVLGAGGKIRFRLLSGFKAVNLWRLPPLTAMADDDKPGVPRRYGKGHQLPQASGCRKRGRLIAVPTTKASKGR